MERANILTTNSFPVKVTLNKINPWGDRISCNSVIIYTNKEVVISSYDELKRLLPIEKYLLIEKDGDNVPVKKTKTNRKSKSEKVETITEKEVTDESEATSEEV